MEERVGRRETHHEGKMDVNEEWDGKINTKGAEKKEDRIGKGKDWKRKSNFGKKKKKTRRKGGKEKEERKGRINLVP